MKKCIGTNYIYNQDINYICYGIYKAPQSDINKFLFTLNNLLNTNKKPLIVRDFNLNLYNQFSDNNVSKYIDIVLSNGFTIINNIDNIWYTRQGNAINTIIDHVITNIFKPKINMVWNDKNISDPYNTQHHCSITNVNTNKNYN